MVEAFLSFASERGVVVGTRGEESDGQAQFSDEDLGADLVQLHALLKGRLATRLYDRSAWYPIWSEVDHLLTESQMLWNPAEDLALRYAEAK